VVHERPTRLLAASILPGSAAPLLDTSIGALSAKWQPFAAFVGPVAGALAAELRAAESVLRRIALLETFLLARFGRVDARVDRAVRTITASDGRIGIDGIYSPDDGNGYDVTTCAPGQPSLIYGLNGTLNLDVLAEKAMGEPSLGVILVCPLLLAWTEQTPPRSGRALE